MSTEEACALLGIRGSCSREELRAAYLALIKEVCTHLPITSDSTLVRTQSEPHLRLCMVYLFWHPLQTPGDAGPVMWLAQRAQERAGRRAYKSTLGCTSHVLAMQAHPDMNPALDTTQEAVRLNEAYAVLQLVSVRLLMSRLCTTWQLLAQ